MALALGVAEGCEQRVHVHLRARVVAVAAAAGVAVAGFRRVDDRPDG
jgi:hypothetical protein